MANSVTFARYKGNPLVFYGDSAVVKDELSLSTVKSFTVEGDPWVFFDSKNYVGNFVIYGAGTYNFPATFSAIRSLRVIPGGIVTSEVELFTEAFFEGQKDPYTSDTAHLPTIYFSLKVKEGAVVFYDGEKYKGPKRILLNGDEVQNFAVVKLPCIGLSMKPAEVTQ